MYVIYAKQQQGFRSGMLKTEILNMIRNHIQCIITVRTNIWVKCGSFLPTSTLEGVLIHLDWLGGLRPYEVNGEKKKKKCVIW